MSKKIELNEHETLLQALDDLGKVATVCIAAYPNLTREHSLAAKILGEITVIKNDLAILNVQKPRDNPALEKQQKKLRESRGFKARYYAEGTVPNQYRTPE